jgi:drug/metabolite transporter superfamily protein YnfA
MLGIIVRGRAAWIASLVFGIALLVVGIVIGQVFLMVAGGAFALFGLVFLILSLVTGGATD